MDAVRPHLAQVRKALPLLDVNDFLELPSLALGLGLAVDRIFVPASPQEIRARQASLRPVRSQALRYLEVAAELGLVPGDRVKKIRANTGPVDEARDGVAIAALFIDSEAALAGKHPFSAGALEQLGDDGNWLISQLLPSGATAEKTERSPQAVVRDQLWTDVLRRYDELYQAGVAIWGRRKVDEHIPALHSRVSAAAATAASKAVPTTPATP